MVIFRELCGGFYLIQVCLYLRVIFNRSVCKSSDISTLENEPEEEEERGGGGVPRPTPHHGLVSGKIKSGGVRGPEGGKRKR